MLLTLFSLLAFLALQAQKSIPTAGEVMMNAYQDAARSNKKVLLIFHASWCGWCHKMDSSLNDPAIKKYFDDNFVIVHLTVLESKEKKNLENSGAEALMEQYNGKEQGLPYWAFLDANGKLLFDSQLRKKQADGTVKGSNIGCPASPEEVKHFVHLLRHLTTLTNDQFLQVPTRFLKKNPQNTVAQID